MIAVARLNWKGRLVMQEVDVRQQVSSTNGTVAIRSEDRAPYQAYQILHWGFVAAPTIAGLDKFTHLLCNWDQYLAPQFARISPIGGHGLMSVVGVVEIAAGLVVAFRPRVGAYVVAAWLAGIILNLLMRGAFYDVALRDFGLALGALALARLASKFDKGSFGRPALAAR